MCGAIRCDRPNAQVPNLGIKYRVHSQPLSGLALVGVGLAICLSAAHAEADQRRRTVVAVTCEATRSLCHELVQALSEIASSHLYRINPTPVPPDAFELHLDLSSAGQVRLRWQEDAAGPPVPLAGVSDTELARRLVAASPALAAALRTPVQTRPIEE